MSTGNLQITALPRALYLARQVRAMDRYAIDQLGVPGFELMQRAARSALRHLLRQWPEVRALDIYCGAGNNGGDGYVMGGLALQRGLAVTCVAVLPVERLQGDARLAWQWALDKGVQVQSWSMAESMQDASLEYGLRVVVDAVLGTGIEGEVRGTAAEAIAHIRLCGLPVLAVDVPSGICADTGQVLGQAVAAAVTVTFIGLKPGLLTGAGANHAGEVHFDDLGLGADIDGVEVPVAQRVDWLQARQLLPQRHKGTHKGDCGRVLVVGGHLGMAGAALLAAEACLRSGAGLVYLATRPEHVAAAIARRPELLVTGIQHGNELDALLSRVDVVVIGPGLGRSAWGRQLWQRVMGWQGPRVIDADGLNLLAEQPAIRLRDTDILTPHPGEAARLLPGADVPGVQQDRFAAVRDLQQRYSGVWALKGPGTLIATADAGIQLATVGNPGMATAGMGDVLSGICGALLAQGVPAAQAAMLAVCWHGAAADRAAVHQGYCGLLASDVVDELGRLARGFDGSPFPEGIKA